MLTVVNISYAEPEWSNLFLGRELEIVLPYATTIAPMTDSLNVEEKYFIPHMMKKLDKRPAAKNTSWLGAIVIECLAQDSVKIDGDSAGILAKWFEHANWVESVDTGITGISPEGVAIVFDAAQEKHVWILQYWQHTVRLRVGYTCGDGFYQILPHSKVAIISDDACKNLLNYLIKN
jgi:hypothetical protein